MAAFPENVRLEAMQEQDDKEPLEATAVAGQNMIDEIVKQVAKYVAGMIDGSNTAEIPPFHT